MRRTFGIAPAAAVLALALGCGKKDSATSGGGGGSAASLEGNWKLVSMEMMGQKLPADKVAEKAKEFKIKATADKLIFVEKGKEEPATYKLNTSKTPNEIDLTDETKKEKQMYGIYKLEGKTLTLCVAMSGKAEDRPKEFKTEGEVPVMIMTLEKE